MSMDLQVAVGQETGRRPVGRGGVTRRLVYALALIPIVPATAEIGASAASDHFIVVGFDGYRWFEIVFSTLWIAATVFVWRRAVLWTLGRGWLTALVSLIPFVQVVYNQPLWNAGCISDDVLRIGQHQVSVGLWIWLAMWVWWGAEKVAMSVEKAQEGPAAVRMTPVSRRIAASVGMFPCVFGVFMVTSVFIESTLKMSYPLDAALTFTVAAVVALFIWCLLWLPAVDWSESVAWRTIGMWVALVALPIGSQFVLLGKMANALETVFQLLPVIGWGVWLGWTVWYWPIRGEMVGSALAEPQCLKCGYSLRGLSATRCPECGAEPTIDELWRGLQGCE